MNVNNKKSKAMNKLKNILNADIKSLGKKSKNRRKDSMLFKNITLPQKLVSLDIGSSSIKIVVGKKVKESIHICNAFSIETPKEIIADGNIINSLELSRIIEKALKDNNVRVKDIVCTSSSTAIINRELIVPKAEEEELDTLVRFEIQRYLPINMDDYVIQYNVLEEIEQDNIDKLKLLVVTYPNRMSKEYFNFIKNSGLKPVSLDVTFNSIKKLLNNSNEINQGENPIQYTTAFLDMGAENLNIHIYNEGKFDFTRVIKSGGKLIDASISKKYDISMKEAEERKIKYADLLEEENLEDLESVNKIVRKQVDEWIEEIMRILQFYKNKKLGNKIDKIYIHGGTSRLKGIDFYIQKKLNIPVVRVNSMSNIASKDRTLEKDFHRYLNAIGSIIRL